MKWMFANNCYQMSNFIVLKNIEGLLKSSPSHVGSRGFAWILSLLIELVNISLQFISVSTEKKGLKKSKRKKKEKVDISLVGWINGLLFCTGSIWDMNIASYPHAHSQLLCARGQGLRATSYFVLFESYRIES